MSESIRKSRTVFTTEQQEVLESLYQQGMTSKGKTTSNLHEEAVLKTGLQMQQILDWIGNKNKVLSQRNYKYPKTNYEKGMSGYNLFVHEKKDEVGSIDGWAESWKALSEEDRNNYRVKAKDFNPPVDPRKKATSLLKKMSGLLKELQDVNVDLVCVGVDINQQQLVSIGHAKAAKFLKTRPEFEDQLYSYFELVSPESGKQDKDVKELRKLCQEHMNQLYRQATGKQGSFPYKAVANNSMVVTGLPANVLPLRTLSNYGEEKLKSLLAVTSLNFQLSSPGNTPAVQPPAAANNIHPLPAPLNSVQPSFTTLQPSDMGQNQLISHSSTPGNSFAVEDSASRIQPTPVAQLIRLQPVPDLSGDSNDENLTFTLESDISQLIGNIVNEEKTLVPLDPKEEEQVHQIKAETVNVEALKSARGKKKSGKKSKSEDLQTGKKKSGKKSKSEDLQTVVDEYPVDKILQRRIKNGMEEVLVKWTGYKKPSWVPASDVRPL